ncbi:tryptophan-rich sensory protein [Gordonia sp. SID5947]|uniref:TspO/MBR family protein n=1 Tax=Gordonia sp. SID5947 TaxID=2690315 RepID=UPI0013708DC9|nr:TspO/MBR family protein [Gordonia sp. SID5947]MYR06302.1 tryptophan-rich sensory protein [Gordonia sp. SID5947]
MRISTLTGTTLASAAAAVVGSVVTKPAVESWYPTLRKPRFVPPNWVFPVAWTALYADLAVTSAATIDGLRDVGDDAARRAYIGALGANLALNAGWTWVYFGQHRLGGASILAAVLTASSADLALRSARVDRRAGVALASYPAWCAFATALSTSTWWLNRDG